MGGQGVGKGTFSAMLRAERDYNYVETGGLLRSAPADSEIAKVIARGELVSDELLFDLLKSHLTNEKDLILDGFPRKLSQAQWLVENFADKFDIRVVYLNVPEDIMVARINKRIREGGGRADDADVNAVRRRLDTFWNVTMPAIDWLRTVKNIKFSDVRVDGPDVNENFAGIKKAIKD